MKFYRSIKQISQTTAKDRYNAYDERPLNLLEINYDSYVPGRLAFIDFGKYLCQFHPSRINKIVVWSEIQDDIGQNINELNNHHNTFWGDIGADILGYVIMAQTSQKSSSRSTSGWIGYTYSAAHLNEYFNNDLSLYLTMLHFFGIEKMRILIRSEEENSGEFNRNKYGKRGAEILRASKIMGRNLRYHFNFHDVENTDIDGGKPEVWEELNKLHLSMFHPVLNIYAVGFIIDGERFVSAGPFEIPPFENVIDFVGTKVQRQNTQWFGDHEFKEARFEKGISSAWKEISKGKYNFTPKEDVTEIEEVIVDYMDTTTNIITKVICQFKQNNGLASYERYINIGNAGLFNDIL